MMAGFVRRRNNRGCKSKDFYNWPEQPLEDMDSPLAVLQHIQQLINKNPADIDTILRLPEGQDLGAWKIEHLRLFCMQLNGLAARLQDCCFPETCNQMTATEQWIFLCAAHKQPNECPAIDYTRHALDSAASLLNNNKYFPSRVTIKESSVAKLGSICRRIYRIFSHAYYHHFQLFDQFEKDTHLCSRFSKFVTMYDLLSKDSLIVPADGSKPMHLEADQFKSPDGPDSSSQIETTMIDNAAGGTQVPACIVENNNGHEATKVSVTPKLEPILEQASVTPPKNVPVATTNSVSSDAELVEKSETISSADETEAPSSKTTASPKLAPTWSPSQMSTNTMVKSTSAKTAASPPDSPASAKQTPVKSEPNTTTDIKATTTPVSKTTT